ncbi:MAG TPA: endonuclease/exonuclease/phosphatase family protein [Paracoccaceae bacterium]|nr:endonuclease/exonuclease/phosphatase family protein [Paracoccaceae bacterium]
MLRVAARLRLAAAAFLAVLASPALAQVPPPAEGSLRVASFNVALSRRGAGLLVRELEKGTSPQLAAIAEIIQIVRPDVLLVNELDHDFEQRALRAFAEALAVGRNGREGVRYGYLFTAPVNTGEPSGLDLDGDGSPLGPGDAFGFGRFPGQYGMALLSRLPIRLAEARSFRLLRWADFPGATLPMRADGTPFPSAEAQAVMRLSSKAHWDLALDWPGGQVVRLLASHPTPPVFDDAHDLNGLRNRDEILFWVRYLDGTAVRDDAGREAPRGPGPVIVLGDLNADPADGDGLHDGIAALLGHPALQDPAPKSPGALAAATEGANRTHRGDPALDTADFRDQDGPGNLRADYVLPSRAFEVTGAGVFWPAPGDPLYRLIGSGRPVSSDHRLVWVDLRLP